MVFFLITEPYHLQPGTAWSCTTCSLALHGELYHLQPGTAWRAVPPAAWYYMESRTTCSLGLHGEPYHMQSGTTYQQCGTASSGSLHALMDTLHGVPCCMWDSSPFTTMLQVVWLSMQYHAVPGAGGTALGVD